MKKLFIFIGVIILLFTTSINQEVYGQSTISFYTPISVTSTTNGATISWATVNHSTATIDYGVNTNYGSVLYDDNFSRAYSGTISGLVSGVTYYYRVTLTETGGSLLTQTYTGSFVTSGETSNPTPNPTLTPTPIATSTTPVTNPSPTPSSTPPSSSSNLTPIFKMDCENSPLNCGWGSIPQNSPYYTITHIEDGGPVSGSDVVRLNHTPQPTGTGQVQYYNGWVRNTESSPSQGSTRYIRFWIKPNSPINFSGTGDVWTDKFIILGDSGAENTRVICNLRDDYGAIGGNGSKMAINCMRNIDGGTSVALNNDQWNFVQIEVKSSTSNSSNDGQIRMWVNSSNYSLPTTVNWSGSPLLTTAWNNLALGWYANTAVASNGRVNYDVGGLELDDQFDSNWSAVSGTTPPPPSDTTPPTVSLTAPTGTVSGTVNITANASDNTAVAGVTFRVNGTTQGTEDTTSPYSVSWNTTTLANGTYTLTAVARDTNNNTTTSQSVTVTVNNTVIPPPTPLPTTFTNNQRIQTTANLNVRVTANGTLLGTQSQGQLGTIVGTGLTVSGTNWWNVDYDNGVDGWSTEQFLQNYVAPTTPPTTTSITPPVTTTPPASGGGTTGGIGVSNPTGTTTTTPPTITLTSTTTTPVINTIKIGDRVQTNAKVNVRLAPEGKRLGTQVRGSQGVVTEGPFSLNGYIWYRVNYISGVDGWTRDDLISKVSTTTMSTQELQNSIASLLLLVKQLQEQLNKLKGN